MAFTTPALTTPTRCTADFSLIPIGSASPSFSQQIADIQQLLQNSGLTFVIHTTGTTIEGSWDQVVQLIGFAHTLIHQKGIARVQTDIRIETRTDKVLPPVGGTVSSVERVFSTSSHCYGESRYADFRAMIQGTVRD